MTQYQQYETLMAARCAGKKPDHATEQEWRDAIDHAKRFWSERIGELEAANKSDPQHIPIRKKNLEEAHRCMALVNGLA